MELPVESNSSNNPGISHEHLRSNRHGGYDQNENQQDESQQQHLHEEVPEEESEEEEEEAEVEGSASDVAANFLDRGFPVVVGALDPVNDDNDHEDDHDPFVLRQALFGGARNDGGGGVQEPSMQVRAAWRAFLESNDLELRLENTLRLTPVCVQFLIDRIQWLPLESRPQKFSLVHVTFVNHPAPILVARTTRETNHDHENTDGDEGRPLYHRNMRPHDHNNNNNNNPHLDPPTYQPHLLTLPDLMDFPYSARLMADCLALNTTQWKSFELEDNINNRRLGSHVCRALLQNLPQVTGLKRLRLHGIDLRSCHAPTTKTAATAAWTSTLIPPNGTTASPQATSQAPPISHHNNKTALSTLSELVRETLQAQRETLREVDLESCRLEDIDVACLAQGLQSLKGLQSLSIYECGMDDGRMECVVQSLVVNDDTTGKSSSSLQQVLLYDNHISPNAFATFAKLVRSHSQLKQLKLAFWGRDDSSSSSSSSCRHLQDCYMQEFNQAVRQHVSLQKLDIYCKNTSSSQVVSWLQVFEQTPSLQEFRFGVFCCTKKKHKTHFIAPTPMDHADATTSSYDSSPFEQQQQQQQQSICLEMKYGMLAGQNVAEMERLFQGIAQLRTIQQLTLNQCHFFAPRVGYGLRQLLQQRQPTECPPTVSSCFSLPPSCQPQDQQQQYQQQQLVDIRLHSCRFHKEPFVEFIQGLNNPQLHTLYLAGCRLDDDMLDSLVFSLLINASQNNDNNSHLGNHPPNSNNNRTRHTTSTCNLQRLDLSWNNLTIVSLDRLIDLLQRCPLLELLNLSHNERLLSPSTAHALNQLDDSANDDDSEREDDHDMVPQDWMAGPGLTGVRHFLNVLIHHPTLQTLDLASCSLVMPMAATLIQAWEDKRTTRSSRGNPTPTQTTAKNIGAGLHLGFVSVESPRRRNNIGDGDDGVELFCGVRAGNRSLFYPLLTAVQGMKQVERLEFCGTDLRGHKSGIALRQMLQSPSLGHRLKELNIHGIETPPMDERMIQPFATGLFHGSNHPLSFQDSSLGTTIALQTLRLGGCSIHDNMFHVLAKNLIESKACQLQSLFLRYNLLTSASLQTLGTLLLHKPSLQNLDLASNEMLFLCNHGDTAGIAPFAEALSGNKSLRRLCLSHCGLEDYGVKHLFRALEWDNPCALIELDIGGNSAIQLPVSGTDDGNYDAPPSTPRSTVRTIMSRISSSTSLSSVSSSSWLDSLSRWKTVKHLILPRTLRSDPLWNDRDCWVGTKLSRNTSICELRCDQGQLPLVYTLNESIVEGFPVPERAIAHVLQRNRLLHWGLEQATLSSFMSSSSHSSSGTITKDHRCNGGDDNGGGSGDGVAMVAGVAGAGSIPWSLLLERLGSTENGDGSPIFAVLRLKAAELLTDQHHRTSTKDASSSSSS